MKKECIYVATRLTATHPIDYLHNLQESIDVGTKVWRKGHYPYIPGLDFLLFMNFRRDYGLGGRNPYNASIEWMRRCDSALFHNGLEDSKGVQMEHEEAQRIGMKIYYSLDEIKDISE